jgi:hypothetical protein
MEADPPGHTNLTREKRCSRVLGIVAAVALAAGLVWKFIWPWTSSRTDLIFLCVGVLGVIAGAAATRSR